MSGAPKGQFRVLAAGGVLGAVMFAAALVITLGGLNEPEVPRRPGLPGAPGTPMPQMPTGLPSLPSLPPGFPTELPSGLPSGFPSVPVPQDGGP